MEQLAHKNTMDFPKVTRFKPETASLLLTVSAPDVMLECLADRHQKSKMQLQELGLPNPKLERWKYTNIIPKLQTMSLKHQKTDFRINTASLNEVQAHQITPSEPNVPTWFLDMLSEKPIGQDQYQDMMLWDASNVMLEEPLLVHLDKGKRESEPLHLTLRAKAGQLLSPRKAIRLEEGAELTIIEHASGDGAYWVNELTQIELLKNAKLKHYIIQDHASESVATSHICLKQHRDSSYEGFVLSQGQGICRQQAHARLMAENASCAFSGLNLLSGNVHADTTLLVEHWAPHCRSDQNYKNVLTNTAKGVFQGKIFVDQQAQDTDGYQLSNTLLLSERAEMNTKPELEIYADDVRCSHGATCGQLDETPMFYLRQRGLSEVQARRLLLEAFMGEVIETITDESFKTQIQKLSEDWIGQYV